jgi:hypothetical protein
MTNQQAFDLQQKHTMRRQQSQSAKNATADGGAQPLAARLQRALGNQALGQLAGQARIQTKLTLGPVGDRYEQEADQVAKQVVQQMNAPSANQPANPSVQRQAPPEAEEKITTKPLVDTIHRAVAGPEEEEMAQPKRLDANVQRAALPEEEEPMQAKPVIQRRSNAEGGEVDDNIEASIQRARGNGSPLTEGVRAPMEHTFGADFGGVNIHTGKEADSLNQSLQARAFTTGKDIFFRQGEYKPESSGGQELLAHELTHVVQQTGNT